MGFSVFPAPSSGLSTSELVAATKWEKISEYKNSTSVSTHTFSSIPQTYRTLKLDIFNVRTSSSTPLPALTLRFNGDSGNNYSQWNNREGSGLTSFQNYTSQSNSLHNLCMNGTIDTNGSSFRIELPNYTSSDPKMITSQGWANDYRYESEGIYRTGSSTNAITSIEVRVASNTFYYENNWTTSYAILYGGI